MSQIFTILLIICGVLVVHLSLIYIVQNHHSNSSNNNAMKLIIDTDAGSDDAVALLLALSLPIDELDILAITCSYGNTNETNVETNVLKILTIAGRSDIAVYAGAEKPLLQNYTAGDYFGKDGLGDIEFDRRIDGNVDRSKHAALAMIDLVKKYPGEVNILTLGPLTNLALATKLDRDFTKNVKRFYVMGGIINENQSNSTANPEVEFNFGLDPEADAIILNSKTNVPSLVLPYDVVLKNGISKQWRKEVLGAINSERIEFLNKAEYAVIERLGVWYSADSITLAVLVWPELIVTSLETRMIIATCGPHKGAVEIDTANDTNVVIVRDFNVEVFKTKLLRYLVQGTNENMVIIDTDAGSDDAVALLLALSVPEKVKIMAITCTYGNTWLSNVEINVLKTLTIVNRSDISVYSGADKPLHENFIASDYLGRDGLSDFEFNRQIVGRIDRSKHAALAMIDLVNRYPGEISIVTLGPLTNVALAIFLDPNFSQKVKRFYVMGSSPSRKGFNVALDPDSSAIFFKTSTVGTKLVTSSVLVTKCAIPKSWRTNVLGKYQSEIVKYANNAESTFLQKEKTWRLADMITVATFIWPELVLNSTVLPISSGMCNDRGNVKFDDYSGNDVELVTDFDIESLKKLLLRYFI